MYPLISIGVALAALVILLRLKVRLGVSMVLAAVLLALLLRVGPMDFVRQLAGEWEGPDAAVTRTTPYTVVMLSILLMTVNLLGLAMQEAGVSERLLPALHGLFRSRRVAIAAIPLMMGMLPTPGGIMLSAPLVRQPGDRIGIDRSRLAAINYWFRHQWEPVWPLFPAVPYIQAMLAVTPLVLIGYNLTLTVAGILGGTVFLLLRGIPARSAEDAPVSGKDAWGQHLRGFLSGFWPIALTAVLYAAIRLPPAAGIVAATTLFMLLHRVSWARARRMIAEAARFDVLLLIGGALSFRVILEAAQAAPEVMSFLMDAHVPPMLLVFLLPFLVAFLTGITMATVATTFPLLTVFFGTGPDCHVGMEVLAFAGIQCGLSLTPVHLCLALSTEYFETRLGNILGCVVGPAAVMAAVGFLMAWLSG